MLKFGLGLGINKGRFLFNPFNLNPLLYYDARSSMVAPFEQPTLDLDPSNPSSLDIITATRAGVATYTDADGVIQSASADTVRVDHVDGVPMILVEPAATNLVDYSNLDTSGLWSKTGFDITQNAILSPDGSTNGTKLEQTSTTRTIGGSFISSATGTSVTYSFWVKKGSGSTHLNSFIIRNNSASPFNQKGAINLETGEIIQNDFGTGNLIVEAYPNGWFKVKATRDTGINIGDQIRIYPPIESSDGTNEIGQYNYTFGHQLEYGSVATSYIPTNGSTVTRNADQLVITGSDFTDFYNQSEGTVYGEFSSKSDVDTALAEFYLNSLNRIITGYIAPNSPYVGLLNVFNGSVDCALTAHSAPLDGTIMRGGFSYKQNNYKSSINGASELSDTSVSVPVNINEIRIGKQGPNYLNGHIKRLIYWPYHSDDL